MARASANLPELTYLKVYRRSAIGLAVAQFALWAVYALTHPASVHHGWDPGGVVVAAMSLSINAIFIMAMLIMLWYEGHRYEDDVNLLLRYRLEPQNNWGMTAFGFAVGTFAMLVLLVVTLSLGTMYPLAVVFGCIMISSTICYVATRRLHQRLMKMANQAYDQRKVADAR